MSTIESAIRAVREAETSADNVAGNMESALYLIQRCENVKETLQALEWAQSNLRTFKFHLEDAIVAVKNAAAEIGEVEK